VDDNLDGGNVEAARCEICGDKHRAAVALEHVEVLEALPLLQPAVEQHSAHTQAYEQVGKAARLADGVDEDEGAPAASGEVLEEVVVDVQLLVGREAAKTVLRDALRDLACWRQVNHQRVFRQIEPLHELCNTLCTPLLCAHGRFALLPTHSLALLLTVLARAVPSPRLILHQRCRKNQCLSAVVALLMPPLLPLLASKALHGLAPALLPLWSGLVGLLATLLGVDSREEAQDIFEVLKVSRLKHAVGFVDHQGQKHVQSSQKWVAQLHLLPQPPWGPDDDLGPPREEAALLVDC